MGYSDLLLDALTVASVFSACFLRFLGLHGKASKSVLCFFALLHLECPFYANARAGGSEHGIVCSGVAAPSRPINRRKRYEERKSHENGP